MSTTPTPCEIAFERYKNLARWRNLWTILLFVFGASVILFLVAAIFLFITNENWLPGALSTLGTIVNATGVGWVVTRRNEAVKEETDAYEDVKKVCGGGALESMGGPETNGGGPTVLRELEAVRKKHLLFGKF